jgi:SNF2 family DNA or RNA helicase
MLRNVPNGTNIILTTYSVFTPKKKGKTIPAILRNTHWDRIILDEGHIIKNAKGTTFQNINRLASTIRWVLSATPVQNSMNDLETLSSWIGWKEDISKFMAEKLIRRTLASEGEKNPRFKLPALASEIVRLEFDLPQEKAMYQSIENEYKTKIEQTEAGWKLYTEALQGILRCRQACCHYQILETRKRKHPTESAVIESTKFSFICKDIMANSREKSIIFCMWTNEIDIMLRCLDQNGVAALKFDGSMSKEAREMTLYNFKHTGIQALVIQIQAGGVGLNLQCATRVYITSPTWNPTHEIQAICRSHRLGQDHIVKCFRLIIKDTIEERMIDIQNKKLAIISDALDDKELLKKMCDVDSVDALDIRTLFGH